jgi:hypothetical protein
LVILSLPSSVRAKAIHDLRTKGDALGAFREGEFNIKDNSLTIARFEIVFM